MPTAWKSRENAYNALFSDGASNRTVSVGYLKPIAPQDKAELPVLLAAEFDLTDVKVLEVVPA